MKTDIVQQMYNNLHALQREIAQGMQNFNSDSLKNIVDKLNSDSKALARQMHKEMKLKETVISIDVKLRGELLDIIHKIQHSPVFLQSLGQLEHQLVPILRAIETHVKKWQPKVEKTDEKPM